MPDISMCMNEKCPLKKQCYRHEAKPSGWQSYMDFQFTVFGNKGVVCDHFWPLEEGYEEELF